MFRIKICGVRSHDQIDAVAEAGGDAVGLNFFPPSVRYVDENLAADLSDHARSCGLRVVGVFVETPTASQVRGVDVVQIHGDQTAADLTTFDAMRLCRAVKLPTGPLRRSSIERRVGETLGRSKATPLLDADGGASHGGTGSRLDWDAIGDWRRSGGRGFVLAGGLTPDNVADAIARTGAAGVDTAGGVERPKGVKDNDLIRRFIQRARRALDRTDADP